ncbi:MAG TPA: winged helix-turn-helix domain-containing protein [Pseudoxanthomonas sp.]
MLNPRAHPLHQESDRLKVGDYVIDLPRREVVSPSLTEPVRLTIKSLHVLLALVGQHGKVVSREALLEWVWPDTMPTDDVLTQAIGQLRKAFADDRDAPRYLETISKGGYRLLAPVEWLDGDGSRALNAVVEDAKAAVCASAIPVTPAASIAPVEPKPRTSLHLVFIAGIALAGIAASIGVWYLTRDAPTAVKAAANSPAQAPIKPLAFITITSRPGRETSPNLSPDGAMVAYVQADAKGYGAVMLQTTAHVPPRQLTTPPPGYSDELPIWSHDGRRLAFVRYNPGSRCQIMVIAASGGSERKLADCFAGSASSYDWTPDDSGLLMGVAIKMPGEVSSPLRLLDIASGQWRVLKYDIAEGDIDTDPGYSPDGRWIVFRRNISLSDLWRMPAAGGTPQRLTTVKGDIRGWDWLPDGSGLLFSLVGGGMGMYRYDLASRELTFVEMGEFGDAPDIARQSPAMVFTLDQSTSGIFRFTLPTAPGGKVIKERVLASSGSEMLPSVSPDGRTLAFMSDRGSRLELWLGELGNPDNARPIESLMPVPRHTPVWSADGSRLLVVGMKGHQQALYEIDAQSERSQLLPVPAPTPIYAAYTDDPDRLLVGSDSGEGRLRVVLYDRTQQPWRELATLQDVALVRFDTTRRQVYFTRMTKPGIWSADTQLRNVELLDAYRPRTPREYKSWNIGADGPYFLEWNEKCGSGWTKMGVPESQPSLCLDREGEPSPVSPGVDRSGKSIYITMNTSSSADIGWADVSTITSGRVAAKPSAR